MFFLLLEHYYCRRSGWPLEFPSYFRLRAKAEAGQAAELAALHRTGPGILSSYLRNVRLALYDKAQQIYLEAGK